MIRAPIKRVETPQDVAQTYSRLPSFLYKLIPEKLINAIAIKPKGGKTAWDVCVAMKENGLIAKPTHEHIIRFAPPLVITEAELLRAIEIIRQTMKQFM